MDGNLEYENKIILVYNKIYINVPEVSLSDFKWYSI